MRKLAHVRLPGYGMPTWAYPRYVTPGPAQTITLLDVPSIKRDNLPTRFDPYTGVVDTFEPQTLPSITRQSRLGSFHASNPGVFQSYFRVRWEGLTGLTANLEEGARALQPNQNPNIRGTKEGQAIMTYDPWPSAGELYPKAL